MNLPAEREVQPTLEPATPLQFRSMDFGPAVETTVLPEAVQEPRVDPRADRVRGAPAGHARRQTAERGRAAAVDPAGAAGCDACARGVRPRKAALLRRPGERGRAAVARYCGACVAPRSRHGPHAAGRRRACGAGTSQGRPAMPYCASQQKMCRPGRRRCTAKAAPWKSKRTLR